jgi:hypothetical protein
VTVVVIIDSVRAVFTFKRHAVMSNDLTGGIREAVIVRAISTIIAVVIFAVVADLLIEEPVVLGAPRHSEG